MNLVLLVGPSGIGKTTTCLRVVELATAYGLRVSGVLSLPVYKDQIKAAISLRDISTGKERILARIVESGENPDIGIWKFDGASLAWGQEVLATLPESDLLLIDEIGPLEIEKDQGLTKALEVLTGKKYYLALVTLRPSLVEKFVDQFSEFTASIRKLNEQNRDAEPELILTELKKMIQAR